MRRRCVPPACWVSSRRPALTALNSALAIVWLPLVTNISLGYFGMSDEVDLQLGKVLEVFVVVLVPVVLGMIVRAKSLRLAQRLDKPFRGASALVLVGLILAMAIEVLGLAGRVALRGCVASVG